MQKTITVRLDEDIYTMIKKAADGEKRTISNFMEVATLNYIVNETLVDDDEMKDILSFEEDIKKGLSDIKEGRYTLID
jgi:uncharacterized protein (DUF1778 family)